MMAGPKYDLPPGSSLRLHQRNLIVQKVTNEGYLTANAKTGDAELISFTYLARACQMPGYNITRPASRVSSQALQRLHSTNTHLTLTADQKAHARFIHAICLAMHEILRRLRNEEDQPDYSFSQRKLANEALRREIAERASEIFGQIIRVDPPAGGLRFVHQLPQGRTLNKYFSSYLIGIDANGGTVDPLDLFVPLDHLKGNRTVRITWLARDMIEDALESLGKLPMGTAIANVHGMVFARINAENTKRRANGLPDLIVPSQATIKFHYKLKYTPTEAVIREKGPRAAKNLRGRGSTDLRALKVGELLEMDEVKLSLVMLAKLCGLWERLAREDRGALAAVDEQNKGRFYLLVMLDVATRMPVGWVFTDAPRAEATMALLRMATRSKERERVRYGCTGTPMPAIGFGLIKNDNGVGMRNATVKEAIIGCHGTSVDARAYASGDKPFVERHFGTLESLLLKILHGYTGRKAGELPGYDALKNAVLDVDAMYEIISRFYIDELPSRRHFGAGLWGRRPADVLAELNDRHMIEAPIDPDLRRIHLGFKVEVTPNDEGVRTFSGIWFNSRELQEAREGLARNEDGEFKRVRPHFGKVSVCVDPDDLNAATVLIPGWHKPITARLQTSAFADMSLQDAIRLVFAYRLEHRQAAEIHNDSIASFRSWLYDKMDHIGVEKGLSRSYVTQAEIEKMAQTAFQGFRIIPSDTESAATPIDQLMYEDPSGTLYRYTDPDDLVDADAQSDPTSVDPNPREAIAAPKPKRSKATKPPKDDPPKTTPLGILGRPRTVKGLE